MVRVVETPLRSIDDGPSLIEIAFPTSDLTSLIIMQEVFNDNVTKLSKLAPCWIWDNDVLLMSIVYSVDRSVSVQLTELHQNCFCVFCRLYM